MHNAGKLPNWTVTANSELGFRVMIERELRAEIEKYDGRALSALLEITRRLGTVPGYLDAVVMLAADRDPFVSEGATWLLKREVETGRGPNADQIVRLMESLDRVTAWQAQLHFCQIASRLQIPDRKVPELQRWLLPLLESDRPFLRAWALDALCRLPGTAADALLDRMAADGSAAVRARVRNLRKDMLKQGAKAALGRPRD